VHGRGLCDEVNSKALNHPNPMNVTPGQFRKAIYITLGLSFPGLVGICSLIFGFSNALQLVVYYPVQIVAGYVAMVLPIERWAIPCRAQLRHFRAGIPFAIVLSVIGVVVGCAASVFAPTGFDFVSSFIWPAFWMSFFGILPAAVFGVVGTGILRWFPPRALQLEP